MGSLGPWPWQYGGAGLPRTQQSPICRQLLPDLVRNSPPVPHGPSCDAKQGRSDCQQLLPAVRGVAFEAMPVAFLLTANTICGPRYGTETLRVDRRFAA